ncbi:MULTISPECIES: hypothetical protein [unclassified Microbacterium]|uniref:hypothetical protein n=1 Tax=unclassified Microbacterium TaxID=2609290 RepID=UPI0004191630|nr:hypothetical protein [Microbacterium sp. B24]
MPRTIPPPLSELEVRLGLEEGTLEGTDKSRAERALDDATSLVLAEVATSVGEKWGSDAPAVVELVVLTAARRGYENPRGIQQETFGAHTVGLSESTGVYLTARELAQVRRAATGRRMVGYTGSVRTPSAYEGGDLPATTYIPVDGSRPVPFLSAADIGSF